MTAASTPVPDSPHNIRQSPYSPSPTRAQSTSATRSRTSGTVFSAKNKLRKPQPATAVDESDEPDVFEETKSAIISSSSLSLSSGRGVSPAARSSPLSGTPPITSRSSAGKYNHNHQFRQSSSALSTSTTSNTNTAAAAAAAADEQHINNTLRNARLAGSTIARPNSSMSILKPTATKAETVRGLRGANHAIRLKILRAFSRLFSLKRSKKDGGGSSGDQANGNTTTVIGGSQPQQQQKKKSRIVRIFIPKSSLEKRQNRDKSKGKSKVSVVERKDSKSVLDLLDGEEPVVVAANGTASVKGNERKDRASPVQGIIVSQAQALMEQKQRQNGEELQRSSSRGMIRLRMKKSDPQARNSAVASTDEGKPRINGKALPPGMVLVEDPTWAAARRSLQQENASTTSLSKTPSRSNTTAGNRNHGSKGKSKDVPNSKSLISAYESATMVQDVHRESERKKIHKHHGKNSGHGKSLSISAPVKVEKMISIGGNTEVSKVDTGIVTPNGMKAPQATPSPAQEFIGLAITTDETKLVSEAVVKKVTVKPTTATHSTLHPYSGVNGGISGAEEEEKRRSWRLPSGFETIDDASSREKSSNGSAANGYSYTSTLNGSGNGSYGNNNHSSRNLITISDRPSSQTSHPPSRVTSVASSSHLSTTSSSSTSRVVSSPSRLRRSPNFNSSHNHNGLSSGSAEELVEFNVRVRPGDLLYDILLEEELKQTQEGGVNGVGRGGGVVELEIESEIEYFTADEMESGAVSEDDGGDVMGRGINGKVGVADDSDVDDNNDGDDDDDDDDDGAGSSASSETGTIRAVEIASEGGTMRGVEIVRKNANGARRSGAAGGGGNWGFSDLLVGSRR